jgi:hypothetical protein
MASSDVSLEVQYGLSQDKYYKTTQKKREPTIYVSARPCTYANNVAIALTMATIGHTYFCPCNGNKITQFSAPPFRTKNKQRQSVLLSRKYTGLINACNAWRYWDLRGFSYCWWWGIINNNTKKKKTLQPFGQPKHLDFFQLIEECQPKWLEFSPND